MVERRVAKTRIDDVRPLGDYGQRSFEFITGVVERDLTDRHVKLFAEPADESGGIAWMTPVPGEIVSLQSLPDVEADALKDTLGRLTEDILSLAQRYADDRDPAAQSLAIALRNSVEVPNDECIFRVGEQPVIVQWAHHLDIYEPPRGVLSRLIAHRSVAASTPPIAETPVTAGPDLVLTAGPQSAARPASSLLWWLGWLLLAAMIAWLLVLALPACGVFGLGFTNFCARADAPVLNIVDDTAELEAEIAALERSAADSERQCIAEAKPEAPPAAPEPTIEDAIREGDTSKLAGCWELESDYTLYENGDEKRPLKVTNWQICFDGKGGGDQELGFNNGMTCKGTATASVEDDGRLSVLDDANLPCTQGLRVLRRRTLCDLGQTGKASCSAVDFKNPRRGQNVIFRRISK